MSEKKMVEAEVHLGEEDIKILRARLGPMAQGYIDQGHMMEYDPLVWWLELEKRVKALEEKEIP